MSRIGAFRSSRSLPAIFLLTAAAAAGGIPRTCAAFDAVIETVDAFPKGAGFSLADAHPAVEWQPGVDEPRITVRYRGPSAESLVIQGPNWSRVATPAPDGDGFVADLPLSSEVTEASVQKISPDGSVEESRLRIRVPEWDVLYRITEDAARAWSGRLGAGPTLFSYRQPSLPDRAGTNLALAGELVRHVALSRWRLRIAGRIDTLLGASGAPGDCRYVEAEAGAGYLLSEPEASWRITLRGGAYYTTLSTAFAGGYHNLVGPRLYPVFSPVISSRWSVDAFARFTPLFLKDPVFIGGYHEWSGGLTVNFRSSTALHWSLGAEYKVLTLAVVGDSPVESRVLAFTAGLAW